MANEQPASDAGEAARTRRRWINLAEILGVIAVLISALTFWNSYRERTGEEAEKAAERSKASARAQTLLLRATADREGERLSLAPADAAQTIQNQRIAFPAALGAAAVDTLIEPRIESRWFERPLLRAHNAARAREGRGDERIPILIATTFFSGGEMHRDVAIYDIGYRIDGGGILGGDKIRLRGLSRIERVSAGRAQAQLDALWLERQPQPARQ